MLDRYLYAFRFFTTWMVLLVLFHHHTHKHINLLLLATVTLVVGLYLSFVNPRKFVFYFEGVRYEYTGLQKFIIVDVIFHVMLMYFVWSRYKGHYVLWEPRTLAAIALLLLYILLHDIKRIYGVHWLEVLAVGFAGLCIYTILWGG